MSDTLRTEKNKFEAENAVLNAKIIDLHEQLKNKEVVYGKSNENSPKQDLLTELQVEKEKHASEKARLERELRMLNETSNYIWSFVCLEYICDCTR